MSKRRRPEHSIITKLEQVDSLIQRKQWVEARDLLESLDQRFPNREDILIELLNVCGELDDMPRYQRVSERLIKIDPNNPDYLLAYAGGCMGNFRPASALLAFRRFLNRWSTHERAADVRKTVADLEPQIGEFLSSAGFSSEDGLETAALHEASLALLDQGKYGQARHKAEELLKRYPNFVPALNNVSQTYFAEGLLDRAISMADRVLALDPDNFHALSNLARYFVLKGEIDKAKSFGDRLRRIESQTMDVWVKKAEAASILGDDAAVFDAFNGAERSGDLDMPAVGGFLYHLAAVAAMRLGNENQARNYWKQALDISPGFDSAQANLNDLNKPVGERHAPWAFDAGNWLMRPVIDELIRTLKPATKRGDDAMTQSARNFLDRHPEMVGLVPILFDRGDAAAREFALNLAELAKTPELLAALRDFALSQRGPDEMRWKAARAANEAGLIAQPVHMWMQGEWRDLLLLDYEMHDEPSFQHPPRVAKLLDESLEAMHDDDVDRAERLVRQGLELEPDAPDFLNNLAAVYERRGQLNEAETLLRQIIAKNPDYSFPHINLARFAIVRGDLSEAESHLKPLLTRKRFNIGEFGFFCNAQMEFYMAKKEMGGVRSWLDMWVSIDPDNLLIEDWRARLGAPLGLGRFLRRRSGG